MDSFGIHAVACTMGGDLNTRHNSIRDLLHDLCKEVGFSVGKEWTGLIDNSKKRPGDLILRGCSASGRKDLAVDVAIISFPIDNKPFSPEKKMDAKASEKIKAYKEQRNIEFTTSSYE